MSEHKVYKNKNNNLIKQNNTKNILSITKKFMITVAVVLFLNQAIAFITGFNIIWSGVKYILNAVDIYTEPKASITFESDGWEDGEPGSWRIRKSAHWTGIDTAEVTFTLNTIEKETIELYEEVIPDVILVLDTSLSMEGDKLDKVKEHSKDFVSSYLTKHSDKTIALVDFDDEGRIILEFTSNIQTLQESIDTLKASGNTNYNDALKRVDDLMQIGDYAERNVGVLFLTDGVPCIDTPNEVATYKMLKSKYPLIAFNGIQYEMGTSITQELRNISDFHKYANMENLGDVFYELTQYTDIYEKFIITDYVKDKYFYINDESDIETLYCTGEEIGTIKLINGDDGSQKVVWDLGTEYKTGSCTTTMKINLTLREEYVNEYNKDFYPTNDGEEAIVKLESESEYTKKSSDTPVLQRIYTVNYDSNPPSDCKIDENFATQNHYAFEIVPLIDEQPTCSGYLFKGWETITSGVTPLGGDKFEMPTKDIIIRAKWSKQSIVKSMTGTTGEKSTLYEIAKIDATNSNGAGTYTGKVSDKFNVNSPSEDGTIYFYTSKTGNNVVFANICWQIVRTTSTGGVKLLYNGQYDEKLKCTEDREENYFQIGTKGFNSPTSSPADAGYMFNTRYTYYSGANTLDTSLWAEDVSYSNGTYTLSKTKVGGMDGTHRYQCEDGTGSCSKVRYYYYFRNGTYYYIILDGEANINVALDNMLGTANYNDAVNNDLNKTPSAMKTYVDTWYQENIESKKDQNGKNYSDYLEDTIFCNDRTVAEYGGWQPGEDLWGYLNHTHSSSSYECPRLIDQFSQANPKAKLTYPVGLLTYAEASKMGSSFRATGQKWWLMTPFRFDIYNIATSGYIQAGGGMYGDYAYSANGVRPVVSLKPGTRISSGNGTTDDPYIINSPA